MIAPCVKLIEAVGKMDGLSYDHLWKVMLQMDMESLMEFCGREDTIDEICSRDAFWIEKIKVDFGYDDDESLIQLMSTWKDTYLFMHQAEVFKFTVKYYKLSTDPEIEIPVWEKVTDVDPEAVNDFFEQVMDAFEEYGIVLDGDDSTNVKNSYFDLSGNILTLWLTFGEGTEPDDSDIENGINWYISESSYNEELPAIERGDDYVILPAVKYLPK